MFTELIAGIIQLFVVCFIMTISAFCGIVTAQAIVTSAATKVAYAAGKVSSTIHSMMEKIKGAGRWILSTSGKGLKATKNGLVAVLPFRKSKDTPDQGIGQAPEVVPA